MEFVGCRRRLKLGGVNQAKPSGLAAYPDTAQQKNQARHRAWGAQLEQFAMSVETWILSFLIAVVVAALLTYIVISVTQVAHPQETSNQAVVKHDWRPSGHIDFAVRLDGVNVPNEDEPREFKLLVEERRIVESIAGGENLEIQWRLARLSEAKTVITQYHKYLSENSLIRSVPDLTASTSPPTVPSDPVDQTNLSIIASAERNP